MLKTKWYKSSVPIGVPNKIKTLLSLENTDIV